MEEVEQDVNATDPSAVDVEAMQKELDNKTKALKQAQEKLKAAKSAVNEETTESSSDEEVTGDDTELTNAIIQGQIAFNRNDDFVRDNETEIYKWMDENQSTSVEEAKKAVAADKYLAAYNNSEPEQGQPLPNVIQPQTTPSQAPQQEESPVDANNAKAFMNNFSVPDAQKEIGDKYVAGL